MFCTHCRTEHSPNSPCKATKEPRPETRHSEEKHPLAGLDNPFWKREEPLNA